MSRSRIPREPNYVPSHPDIPNTKQWYYQRFIEGSKEAHANNSTVDKRQLTSNQDLFDFLSEAIRTDSKKFAGLNIPPSPLAENDAPITFIVKALVINYVLAGGGTKAKNKNALFIDKINLYHLLDDVCAQYPEFFFKHTNHNGQSLYALAREANAEDSVIMRMLNKHLFFTHLKEESDYLQKDTLVLITELKMLSELPEDTSAIPGAKEALAHIKDAATKALNLVYEKSSPSEALKYARELPWINANLSHKHTQYKNHLNLLKKLNDFPNNHPDTGKRERIAELKATANNIFLDETTEKNIRAFFILEQLNETTNNASQDNATLPARTKALEKMRGAILTAYTDKSAPLHTQVDKIQADYLQLKNIDKLNKNIYLLINYNFKKEMIALANKLIEEAYEKIGKDNSVAQLEIINEWVNRLPVYEAIQSQINISDHKLPNRVLALENLLKKVTSAERVDLESLQKDLRQFSNIDISIRKLLKSLDALPQFENNDRSVIIKKLKEQVVGLYINDSELKTINTKIKNFVQLDQAIISDQELQIRKGDSDLLKNNLAKLKADALMTYATLYENENLLNGNSLYLNIKENYRLYHSACIAFDKVQEKPEPVKVEPIAPQKTTPTISQASLTSEEPDTDTKKQQLLEKESIEKLYGLCIKYESTLPKEYNEKNKKMYHVMHTLLATLRNPATDNTNKLKYFAQTLDDHSKTFNLRNDPQTKKFVKHILKILATVLLSIPTIGLVAAGFALYGKAKHGDASHFWKKPKTKRSTFVKNAREIHQFHTDEVKKIRSKK